MLCAGADAEEASSRECCGRRVERKIDSVEDGVQNEDGAEMYEVARLDSRANMSRDNQTEQSAPHTASSASQAQQQGRGVTSWV